MKPFSLEEYLKNPNRKVVTGDGRNVRIICTDSKIRHYPIIALVEEPSGFENIFLYTEGGQMLSYEPSEKYNLFFVPEKHEGWVNVIRDMVHNEVYCGNMIYASKEEAERIANNATLAIAKIEWEE